MYKATAAGVFNYNLDGKVIGSKSLPKGRKKEGFNSFL